MAKNNDGTKKPIADSKGKVKIKCLNKNMHSAAIGGKTYQIPDGGVFEVHPDHANEIMGHPAFEYAE